MDKKQLGYIIALIALTLVSYFGYQFVDYNRYGKEVEQLVNSEFQQFPYVFTEAAADAVVEDGDRVNMDFVGTVDGAEFEGGSANGVSSVIGLGRFITGFEEQIVGHKAGETFDIKVTFPEDYGTESLNGKDAIFKITLLKVEKKKEITEPTDEWAKTFTEMVGMQPLDLAQFKELLKEQYVIPKYEQNKNQTQTAQ